MHKGYRGVLDSRTHKERAPIIDGLGRAPPRSRAAGHLITENCQCSTESDSVAVRGQWVASPV